MGTPHDPASQRGQAGQNGPSADAPPEAARSGLPAWTRLHLWQIQPVRDLMMLAGLVGVVWLGYRLSIVTVPLLLAMLLAYLVEPLVRKITARGRVRRPFAALGIIVGLGLAVGVPLTLGGIFAVGQGVQAARTTANKVDALLQSVDAPDDEALRERLRGNWLRVRDFIVEQRKAADARASGADSATLPSDRGADASVVAPGRAAGEGTVAAPQAGPSPDAGEDQEPEGMAAVIDAGVRSIGLELSTALAWAGEQLRANARAIGSGVLQAGGGALGVVVGVFGSIGALVFGLVLTTFFFYFVCVGWPSVLATLHGLVPATRRERVLELAGKMDAVVAGFVRGRVTICLSMIVLYTIGYWLIGVPAPFVLGPLTGLLTLVPYAAGLSAPIAMVLMWLNIGGSIDAESWRASWWWIVGGPLLVLAIAQFVDDWILTPAIQGKSTNMAVPLIVIASIAGGTLAGFYGLLLAIPVAACLKIVLQEVLLPRVRAWSSGRAPDVLPWSRE